MISRKTTISAAALLIASAGAAAAFPATATTDLNVRSGPGTGYSVVDQLAAGDTVEIVATQGSWYRTAEGGWASGSYLDAQGGGDQTSYYGGSDYGPAAFYYGSNPYYYDDAGFYFYIDGGRRHQVGWDWFRDHNHRDFRWSNDRYRRDFEGRRGNWDRDRSANRGDGQRGDGRRGDGQRGDGGVSADADVNRGETLRSGRASSERQADVPRANRSNEGAGRSNDGIQRGPNWRPREGYGAN